MTPGVVVMTIDTRPAEEITAGIHAVARLGRWAPDNRLVRGIDRFTRTATREPAAVVWVANRLGLGAHRTVEVPLADITIRSGRTS